MKPRSLAQLKEHATNLAGERGHKLTRWQRSFVNRAVHFARCYFCQDKISVNVRPHDSEAEVFGELLSTKCGENPNV